MLQKDTLLIERVASQNGKGDRAIPFAHDVRRDGSKLEVTRRLRNSENDETLFTDASVSSACVCSASVSPGIEDEVDDHGDVSCDLVRTAHCPEQVDRCADVTIL